MDEENTPAEHAGEICAGCEQVISASGLCQDGCSYDRLLKDRPIKEKADA